jgi:hypothetical protein
MEATPKTQGYLYMNIDFLGWYYHFTVLYEEKTHEIFGIAFHAGSRSINLTIPLTLWV